jgi:hypothetical protein
MYKTIEHKHPPSPPKIDELQLVEAKEPVVAAPVDKQIVKLCTCSTSFCAVYQSVKLLQQACAHGFPLTAFHGGFNAGVYASQDVLEYALQHGVPRFEVYLVLQLLAECRQCAI